MANDVDIVSCAYQPHTFFGEALFKSFAHLINFNLKSHMWLAAAILNSVGADNKNAGYRNSDLKKKKKLALAGVT